MRNIYESKKVEILKITKHTDLEWTFTLKCDISKEPGRFIMVSLPHFGEAPISISGFHTESIDILVRNVGKVTSGIFKRKKGDFIFMRGPYGNTFPIDKFVNKHLLLIAGGSGVAAVKSLADYFSGNKKRSLKKLDLLFGFRSPKHLLFKSEIKQWQKTNGVILTVDTTEDDDESWAGGIGFVVDFIKNVEDIGENTNVVVVGPPRMVTNTIRELLNNNINECNIWLSLERHMKCGVGKCGHCRIRTEYVCQDGPVFNYIDAKELLD